jgi:hypothetical protein
MEMEMKTASLHNSRRVDGGLLYFALLPFFFLSEGIRRAGSELKHDPTPLTPHTWFGEAKSQASIATSYALVALSMLQ